MLLLAKSLKETPVFSHLTVHQVLNILHRSTICVVSDGNALPVPDDAFKHHLLILDGDIKTNNPWLYYGNEMQYCWRVPSDESQNKIAILSSAARMLHARTIGRTRYLIIDGDQVDQLSATNQRRSKNIADHPLPRHKTSFCVSANPSSNANPVQWRLYSVNR